MKVELQKSESIGELIQAVVAVMLSTEGIEKNLTVGAGKNAYKGVADKDVKNTIRANMAAYGLIILPVGIDAKTTVSEWMGTNSYNEPTRKQSVFTEVLTSYLLAHESGEYVVICGYGHGEDSQDKSAGKATTYALKNTLLYSFLVATGTIDDTDNQHSDQKETPPAKNAKPLPPLQKPVQPKAEAEKPKAGKVLLRKFTDGGDITVNWEKSTKALREGSKTIEDIKTYCEIPAELKEELKEIIKVSSKQQ